MNERDILYESFKQTQENRSKQNFNAFMDGLESGLISDLDKLFVSGDMDKYQQTLDHIKSQGIRVFRNNAGKHKLKFI